MNPFDRARQQAIAARSQLSAHSPAPLASPQLLDNIETVFNVAVDRMPHGHPLLGNGCGALRRDQRTIYVRNDVSLADGAYLIAHELGHWFLDADKKELTVAELSAIYASHGSSATMIVESYGTHERLELQANVFARELLMPRDLARDLWGKGLTSEQIATAWVVPLEVVRQQMIDALMLPALPPHPGSPLPTLDKAQLSAATAVERFVNVVAGPGTGKTTTLVHRIKHLIESGVEPNKILALTFTNKAANELVERLKASAIQGASDVWAGTFHAFGLEFLRKFHHLYNLPSEVQVADLLMQVRLLVRQLPKVTLKYYLRLQDPYDWIPDVLGYIKRLKEELITPQEYRNRLSLLGPCDPDVDAQRHDVAVLYEAFQVAMADKKLVDYTDLIAHPSRQAKSNRAAIGLFIDHYDHVLVDEYQDVTEVMVELLRHLAVNAKSVWVVGDVRQAIHHWRGASIMSLVKFGPAFSALAAKSTAKSYSLQINRRSSPEILSLFSIAGKRHALESRQPLEAVVPSKGSQGKVPTLFTCISSRAESATLLQNIQHLNQAGTKFRDQAIISRRTADIERVAEDLALANVPFLHIGDLFQRPEIKKLMCLIQLLCTRQPRSLVGLMYDPQFGFDVSDIELLINATAAGTGTGFQRGKWIFKPVAGLSPNGAVAKANLAALLQGCHRRMTPWQLVCKLLIDRRFGVPPVADQSIAAHTIRLCLWLFAYCVRNADGDGAQPKLSEFLLREDLRRRIGEKLADRGLPPEARALDAISLLTVHASKGLEFSAVHVVDVDNSAYGPDRPFNYNYRPLMIVPPEILNSSAAEHQFEESVERNNLLYVALSRAKDDLFLYEVDAAKRPLPIRVAGTALKHHDGIRIRQVPAPVPPSTSTHPVEPISFGALETYLACPLQYHYRYELSLTAEQEIDISIRARWAVMDMLRAHLMDNIPAQAALDDAWTLHRLPPPEDDPGLRRDAVEAANRGLKVFKDLGGKVVDGLVSELEGLKITLPWLIYVKDSNGHHLHWLRAQGLGHTLSQFRPLMRSINGQRVANGTVHSLTTGTQSSEACSKMPERTAVYHAVTGFLAGDRQPKKGWACGRCAYLSICSNRP
ncbi:ATP-dependent helicase [Pseudomonas sp. Root562]|uniref:ATP-dependent helicase n=1 Tax=Pseudomonas sp. Root562 TaxID=1736561 RepID=UPI0007039EC0|nr:ATP-dependent helicase [Pseudomonas sp. Root562]KQZ81238.1 AAA family ATPase [Pseudomonas sp. Root562]